MIPKRKKKHQQRRQLSQVNKTLNYFVIRYDTNTGATSNETFEPHTNSRGNISGRITVEETVHVKIKSLKTILTTELRKWLILLLRLDSRKPDA